MPADFTDVRPLEEPLAELERALIDEYLHGAGHDQAVLRASNEAGARSLLIEASKYAAARLTEVESRAHYLRELHHNE
jgi:hypothetical protein